MAEDLTVDVGELVDGIIVVDLSGELDLNTSRALDDALAGIERAGALLVLDCGHLQFCDSTGLAIITRHRPVMLRSPQPAVRRLLEITALEELLEPEDDPVPDNA